MHIFAQHRSCLKTREMVASVSHEKMNFSFAHLFLDDLAVPGWVSVIMLSVITELNAAVPIVSGILLLCGQGVRWYLEHKMKKERHGKAMLVLDKMLNDKIPINQEIVEKLLDDK